MALTRSSRYGNPPGDPRPSAQTVRLVPFTAGMQPGTSWPLLPPGSAQSMSNFVPLDGGLEPRSRLSSIVTVKVLSQISGMAIVTDPNGQEDSVWLSTGTMHGLMDSFGSVSRASFTSAFGFGTAPTTTQTEWQYAQIFSDSVNDNQLIAAGRASHDTLISLCPDSTQKPLFSYLTSAPRAKSVGVYDNYVIAFNCADPGNNNNPATSRVQWCVRGEPSNWTGEGSGFEDLLGMRGDGKAVWPTPDGRYLLFSSREIWYGVSATYPAQFHFYPLEPNIGCECPRTIQDTDIGVVFLGSDSALRVIPRGGGQSQVLAPTLQPFIRDTNTAGTPNAGWGVYDWESKLYYLFIGRVLQSGLPIVINLATGEFGQLSYNVTATAGVSSRLRSSWVGTGNMLFGLSTGTVCAFNSTLSLEFGSAVSSIWESAPIGADLPGDQKQILNTRLDYRSTSTGTVNLFISANGGETYGSSHYTFTIGPRRRMGRASVDLYEGAAYPTIKLTSDSTGYSLQRLDATITFEGRDV